MAIWDPIQSLLALGRDVAAVGAGQIVVPVQDGVQSIRIELD